MIRRVQLLDSTLQLDSQLDSPRVLLPGNWTDMDTVDLMNSICTS